MDTHLHQPYVNKPAERLTIERVGLKFGLILAGANIGYFLLMAAIGLETTTWLRVGNFILMFLVTYRAVQYFKHHVKGYWTYMKGLGAGMYTILIGALPFAIFLMLYSLIDYNFIETLKETQPMGRYFNPFFVSFLAFVEMLVYGFIFVFTIMQRLKSSHFSNPYHK